VQEFLSSTWGVALSIFAVVVLAAVSVALLWEGIRGFRRQRAVNKQLDQLSGRGPAAGDERGASLLQQERSSELAWLEPVLLRLPHRHDIKHLLDQSDSSWSVGTFLMLSGGVAAAAGLAATVLTGNWIVPAVAFVGGALAPYGYLRRKRRKRQEAFEEHFPDAIDLLARSIRAGHAFTTGVQVIAEESPAPVSDEFRQVFEEQKFGLALRDSLLGLSDRVPSVDVRMFVTSVMIQRESGGNLAENLDNLSSIIRQRFKFKRELRTQTAQGRMTGYVLALAPVVAGLGMWAINRPYMELLWTEDLGLVMLGVAVGMQIVGFFVIRRIVDIEF
jgi:tight adherence protein B